MANFNISLIDPSTGSVDIAVSSGVLSVTDHSNYDTNTEAGHARSDFSDFYKVLITLPSGNTFLYSSLGDGQESVSAPSAGDPSVDYIYPSGDGQYWVTVYTLPTYNPAAAYLFSTAPIVYYLGHIWKALTDSAAVTPVEGVNWTEVVSIDDLPDKYRLAERAVIYADCKKFYARRLYNANCINNLIGDNWEKLIRDPDFIIAVEMFISINAVPVLMTYSRWTEIDSCINLMKYLSSKGEVL